MRRTQLAWGGVLLLAGLLMLADGMGIRLPNGTSFMSLLWPVLLMVLGISVLIGVFVRADVDTKSETIDLQGASEALIRLRHGAGELQLHGGAHTNELAHGTFSGGLEHSASRNENKLEVKLRPARDFISFPFMGSGAQLDWDISLSQDIPIALEMRLGANKSTINLEDLKISNLKVKSGASEMSISLPKEGRFNAEFDLGATSMTIFIPAGLSARIHASLGAADLSLDKVRFPRQGSYYESPDYASAANSVDLNIKAGAASVEIR